MKRVQGESVEMELEMSRSLAPAVEGRNSVLLIAELLHRSRNEYARGISLASLIAARSCSEETKAALGQVVDYLRRSVETQRLLCPPIRPGARNFAENLTELCRAMTASFDLEQRGITLLLRVDEPLWLDSRQSWRIGLIVFELVNNACRHAFEGRGGCISVAVAAAPSRMVCRVSDDGASASHFAPGLGTDIVDALAAELGGVIERRHTDRGTDVTVSIPREA
jgi:two-component sensor histidine kinase